MPKRITTAVLAALAAPLPYGVLPQRERTRYHSLSNIAFTIAIVAWVLIGWRLYRLEQRAISARSTTEVLTAAIMTLKQAIVVCNDAGEITLASPEAEKIFNKSLIGRHIHDGVPAAQREQADAAFMHIVNEVRASRKPAVLTLDHVVTDITKQHEFTLSLRVIPERREHVTVVATFTPRAYVKEFPPISRGRLGGG